MENDMRNIALRLQYNGSAYHGWQRQDNARSVEQVLQMAIEQISGEQIVVYGCGRTDAGVHALNYVCNFISNTKNAQCTHVHFRFFDLKCLAILASFLY